MSDPKLVDPLGDFVLARCAEVEAVAQRAITEHGSQWKARLGCETHPYGAEGWVIETPINAAPGKYGNEEFGELWNSDGGHRLTTEAGADHVAAHDPMSAIVELSGIRALVALYRHAQHGRLLDQRRSAPAAPPAIALLDREITLHEAVRVLAMRWSGHPDYDPYWAPPPPLLEAARAFGWRE